MRGVNKVILVGMLGQDPELKHMPSGDALTIISVATNQEWTDKQTNEKRQHTEWHRVIFFRQRAKTAAQYLKKGSKVYIDGELRTKTYQGSNGEDKKVTEIHVNDFEMLDRKPAPEENIPF